MLIKFYNTDFVNQRFKLAIQNIIISILILFIVIHLTNWNNTISIIFNLIILSSIISYISTKIFSSSWIGIILFMVYVGGLIILFTITTSLISIPILKSTVYSNIFIIIILLSASSILLINKNELVSNIVYKTNIIVIVILIVILNLILIRISKIIFSPIKSFRRNFLKVSSKNIWFRIKK